MAFDEADGQPKLALELVEMAVEQADFAFVERGRAQFGGCGQEQLGGVDDFAVGMLHGFHHIVADVAFTGCCGQMAAAFDHAGVDFAHFNHVLLQTLARHALTVADFCNHFGAVGEVVGKHEAPHQGGAQGQKFGGGNGDGGTNQNVHGAHQTAVEPMVAAVADEHTHGQTGKHGDVAVFADRRPTGHRAGGTDNQIEENAVLQIMLVQP